MADPKNSGSTGRRAAAPQADASAQTGAPSTPDAAAEPQDAAAPAANDQNAAPEATLVDQVMERGKQWLNDSGLGERVNDLPQLLRDLSSRALGRVNGLSTTQKVVGGAILAAGLGWLAVRGGRRAAAGRSWSRYDDGMEPLGAAAGNRPGQRYSSNAYGGRGSAGYASGDATRSQAASSGSSNDYGNRFGNRTSYQRGSHFSPGSTDGFGSSKEE